MQNKHITVISDRKEIVLNTEMILYIMKVDKNIQIHMSDGKMYKTRMTLAEIENLIGDGFIKIHRGCMVSAMAVHDITDSIQLVNGESLTYTIRKKKEIIDRFRSIRRNIVGSFSRDGIPVTEADYMDYYRSFDNMPFAFADIEMVFDDNKHAVDWFFRYGNRSLAELLKNVVLLGRRSRMSHGTVRELTSPLPQKKKNTAWSGSYLMILSCFSMIHSVLSMS